MVVQGLSGIAGGFGLLSDPTGTAIGIPLDWLRDSPFPDYLVPGAFLFTALGIAPLIVAFGLVRRRTWSWYGALAVGLTLLAWLVVEVLVIGYQPEPPLQLIYGVIGVVIVGLALLPAVRQELTTAAGATRR